MLLLDHCFCGLDALCVTPSAAGSLTGLKLCNGMFDDLFFTGETASAPTDLCPAEWDWDTIFHAAFDDNTNAGNVDWSLNTVSHLLIKRRETGSFRWTTLQVQEVRTLADFNLTGIDTSNASSTEYDYAVVPALYGIEGIYSSVHVKSEFRGIFLVERDRLYGTYMTDGFCDTTRNVPSTVTATVNSRYPTYIRGTAASYDTGSCGGQFIAATLSGCEPVVEDAGRVSYQREVMEFLSDGKPKLLKHFDGRMWLIEVTGNPTDTADNVYFNRSLSFEWTEIGDCRSEEALYCAGLSEVTAEWWNR